MTSPTTDRAPGSITGVLNHIDAALDGLCPCGADPAPGSTYCGEDCRPTHIGDDTDTRATGAYTTPMRWRPDLVTAADDSDLIPLDPNRFGYTGRFNAQVFGRAGCDVWHLRLDDGHRYVGVDIDRDDLISLELAERIWEAWRRLERELADPRHAVPDRDDPGVDFRSFEDLLLRAIADSARAAWIPMWAALPDRLDGRRRRR